MARTAHTPTTRRGFLLGTSAVALATALPSVPAPAAVIAPPKPPLPTWIVGTPGEADHEVIRAVTREAAVLLRCEPCDFEGDPDADPAAFEGGPDCGCYACSVRGNFEATRVEKWDGRAEDSITDADWMRAGFETRCSRCSYETSFDMCGRVVSDKPVCDECLTLADWDIVDPEHAAELRAEAEDDDLPARPLPCSLEA